MSVRLLRPDIRQTAILPNRYTMGKTQMPLTHIMLLAHSVLGKALMIDFLNPKAW